MAKNDEAKEGRFSFERGAKPNAPKEGEHEFTFSDVPVLGGEAAKLKGKFSFEGHERAEAKNAEDAALASYEQMLREMPAAAPSPDGEEQEAPPAPDVSHGLDQGFLAEQRRRWLDKVRKAKLERRLAISAKLAYVLIPIVILAGLIYLIGSLWFQYQAEEDAKRNYVTKRRRPLLDLKLAEEARKLKEAMEQDLAKADQSLAAGEFAQALEQYQDLAGREFFKPGFLHPRLGRCLAKLDRSAEAIAAYREALAAGPMAAATYTEAALLFNQNGLAEESVAALQAGMKAFPEDLALAPMLAESFFVLGKHQEALAVFKELKRSDMTERQLHILARLFQAAGQRDEAWKVHFFSAKRSGSLPSYLAAAEVSGKPAEQVEIMVHAAGALADGREVNAARTLLVKYLCEAGKADAAKAQLQQIDASRILPAQVPDLVDVCLKLNLADDQLKAVLAKLREGFPEQFEVHLTIQERLLAAKRDSLILHFYGEWWAKSPGNAVANYMYGLALRGGSEAIERFQRATLLKPDFLPAWRALAESSFAVKKWAAAEDAYRACVRLDSGNREFRHQLAFVNLYSGKGAAAVDDYASYLRESGMPELEQTRLLLDLAQRLPTPEHAERLLAKLREFPGTAEECRLQELRNKSLYGLLSDRDFEQPVPRAAREIRQLHLLSQGKIRDLLLMPTPPEEFPEFWKVFLCRLTNVDWKENAERLVERHRQSLDPTIPLLAAVWLGRVTPDDARAMSDRIPPEQEPLFFFILAEEYRRQKNQVGANICYTRAAGIRPNPLIKVIEYFNRPRRAF